MRTEFKKLAFVIVSFFLATLVNAADLQSDICQPAPDGQSCRQTACPDSNQQCIPTKIRVNYSEQAPTYTVLECQCKNQQTDCHININPQFEVYVTGICSNPNYPCQLIETDNGDGTIDYESDCGLIQSEAASEDSLPGKATNVSPANGATGVSRTGTSLTWVAGSGTVDSHDVYFGTTNPPPFKVNQTATSYATGTMGQGKLYYWRIDEINNGGTATGDVWNFRVEECVKSTAPFYTAWKGGGAWNRPDCWCYKRHCRGDADGLKQLSLYWVYVQDLTILRSAYGKIDSQMTGNRICADFDRAKALNLYRVYTNDLTILRLYYGKGEAQVKCCDFDQNCTLAAGDYFNFWTN